jgi:RNA polymerase sigma factor (sigma-70 family)
VVRKASDSTIDTDSLFIRLTRNGEQDAWKQVLERYTPPLNGFARKLELNPVWAEDAIQNTLLAFWSALKNGDYERQRSRLRDYLFGIARHKFIDELRNDRHLTPAQSAWLQTLPSESDLESIWHAEWVIAISERCLREAQTRFSDTTYRIFAARCLAHRTSAEVAAEFNKTVHAIDKAVQGVRDHLRTIRPVIEELY